jgi:hypothetical protein
MLIRWEKEFLAIQAIVNARGDLRQKDEMREFMRIKKVFLDNFPSSPNNPGAIQQAIRTIGQFLNRAINSFEELADAVRDIAQVIGDLNFSKLFGSSDDETARNVTNELFSRTLLALSPSRFKLDLINIMLDSLSTGDEDEQAILKILEESRKRSVAEFLQLIAGATWERLDYNMDGQESDELYRLFKFSPPF